MFQVTQDYISFMSVHVLVPCESRVIGAFFLQENGLLIFQDATCMNLILQFRGIKSKKC